MLVHLVEASPRYATVEPTIADNYLFRVLIIARADEVLVEACVADAKSTLFVARAESGVGTHVKEDPRGTLAWACGISGVAHHAVIGCALAPTWPTKESKDRLLPLEDAVGVFNTDDCVEGLTGYLG
jgi:hypothetical protein